MGYEVPATKRLRRRQSHHLPRRGPVTLLSISPVERYGVSVWRCDELVDQTGQIFEPKALQGR
jgi:hypothetical protein